MRMFFTHFFTDVDPLFSPALTHFYPRWFTVALDLVSTSTDGGSGKKTERRHSITVCESPAPFKVTEATDARHDGDGASDGDDECDTPTADSGTASDCVDPVARTAQFIWPHVSN